MRKITALIPARGGSKGMLQKNIKKFAGKPLISHTIEQALSTSLIDSVYVSTDDDKIANISRKAGAKVPFIRPSEYVQDDSLDLPVFVHFITWVKQYERYNPEIIVHLRPTSPLRTVSMIEKAIKLLIENADADSVRTVCLPTQNPHKMWTINPDGYLSPIIRTEMHEQWNQPRQTLPNVYWQNGYVDVTRNNTIIKKQSMTGNNILPLLVEESNFIDIDNEYTFHLAEKIFLEQDKKI